MCILAISLSFGNRSVLKFPPESSVKISDFPEKRSRVVSFSVPFLFPHRDTASGPTRPVARSFIMHQV